MKLRKYLSTTLAAVMLVSQLALPGAAPAVAAVESADTLVTYLASPAMNDEKCYAMSNPNSDRNKGKLFDVATNDVISFYVRPVAGTASSIEKADMYVRCGSSKATYNGTGKDVYSGNSIPANAENMGNGWYYIVCTAHADGDYDLCIDNVNMDGTLGQSYIGGIRINGVEVPAGQLDGLTACGTIGNPSAQIDDPTPTAPTTPSNSPWVNQNYEGTIPSQYTANQEPYTWQINTSKGGLTTLPAVVTAATGMYDNITNQTDKLRNALKTVKFRDPNNMIFIISDGFGPNMLKVTEQYSRDMIINDLPNIGASRTQSYQQSGSLSYTTTDSAAGGTALSSGYKTRYKNQGLDANGKAIPSISYELRRQFGKIIGVVSTGWAYDSTPAVYADCHSNRDNTSLTGQQMLNFGPDLFIGNHVSDYSNVYETIKKQGGPSIGWYSNWSTAIRDTTSARMWISVDDDVKYNDRFSASHPTISQMMAYSLTWLQKKSLASNDVGFFLMFENGMTDMAGHGEHTNESTEKKDDKARCERVIGETRATNEVLCIALKFACENPDTIVILTADHDTGGLTLNSGWESDMSKCKFTTTGHSKQDVGIYAVGKNTEVFNGQTMENCQVGKVTAYLMGLEDFGSDDPQWAIDGIIAGVQQGGDEPALDENRITGKALHVMTTKNTDSLAVTVNGASAKAHGMVEVAVRVPAGATSLEFYADSAEAGNLLMENELDQVLNYVAAYDQYQVTIKSSKDFSNLVIVARGDIKAKDEMVIDTLAVIGGTIDFEDFSVSDLVTGEGVKAGFTAADVLETISIYPAAISAEVGDSRKAAVTFDTGLSAGVNIEWTIDNEAVAAIAGDKTGVTVTVAGEGSAVVTATLSNGISETLAVTGRKAGAVIIGDVNSDGVVDDDDAIYLLFHCFFAKDYPVKQNCDFNSDGVVDDDDAIYLLFNVFFPERYPLPTGEETTAGSQSGNAIELPRIKI